MRNNSQSLVVIGGASLDVLHFSGRTVRSAGGAGLYAALAANRAGARVTMVGPRPEPMPGELASATKCLDWRGPVVPPRPHPIRLPLAPCTPQGRPSLDLLLPRQTVGSPN